MAFDYNEVRRVMEKPTYPPELKNNLALLSYESGIRFLFSYENQADFVN